ncbi:MAG: recombination-associated protein RdgC [Succinivibrionaceae bacterium]|jgi:recombination associated protein RdgC|nr:recombination-associated protein RdgC [Succinivibrionaceae bacterium]MBQ8978039.1 recombination-associated protein RdgC [Succinivibrionaceae bacterium]
MWFKNLKVYKLKELIKLDQEAIEKSLNSFVFSPCGSLDLEKSGFVPPLGRLSEALLDVVDGQYIVCVRFEKKLLPMTVVREQVAEKIEQYTAEHNRAPRGKEKTELKDSVMLALIPKAFATHSDIYAWIDNVNGFVYVDTSSDKKAENVLSLIRKALGTLPVVPLDVKESVTTVTTNWLLKNQIPSRFELGTQINLVSTRDENKTVAAKSSDLLEDDIIQHLRGDKIVSKLSLIFDNEFSFMIDDQLSIKRIKFSEDIVHPEENDNYDQQEKDELEQMNSDFFIQTASFRKLIPYLIEQFGGINEAE